MKIFISSLISGFGEYRAAARRAVSTLRHEPIMAEDFGAQPSTPQAACLNGVRGADVVILLLGSNYGTVQPSGVSATEEEFREARERKPVIAFVQVGAEPDARQKALITAVEGWSGGTFRGSFQTPEELQDGVTRALHDYELANAVGRVDQVELANRAVFGLPDGRGRHNPGPTLVAAVSCGPQQRLLRPIEIEAKPFAEEVHQNALFGLARVLNPSKGVDVEVDGDRLVLEQEQGARIALSEDGAISLELPINDHDGRLQRQQSGFPGIIEENVRERIGAALGYASWLLERIDPTQKISHVAIALRIDGGDYMPWILRSQARNSSHSIPTSRGDDRKPVHLVQPRPALRLDRERLIDDLLVPLRRGWKT